MNNAVFEKIVENVRKHRGMKGVTSERRNYLVSESIYYTAKFFAENLLAIEMKNTKIVLKKPVYLKL